MAQRVRKAWLRKEGKLSNYMDWGWWEEWKHLVQWWLDTGEGGQGGSLNTKKQIKEIN